MFPKEEVKDVKVVLGDIVASLKSHVPRANAEWLEAARRVVEGYQFPPGEAPLKSFYAQDSERQEWFVRLENRKAKIYRAVRFENGGLGFNHHDVNFEGEIESISEPEVRNGRPDYDVFEVWIVIPVRFAGFQHQLYLYAISLATQHAHHYGE